MDHLAHHVLHDVSLDCPIGPEYVHVPKICDLTRGWFHFGVLDGRMKQT